MDSWIVEIQGIIQDAFAGEDSTVLELRLRIEVWLEDVMEGGFTIVVVVSAQIVIQHKTLNALLLGALSFLLRPHCDREVGIGWQVDGTCL